MRNRWRILGYALIIAVCAIYLASGLYALQSGQQALILRFGKVVRTVSDSGVHYHLPAPFEQVVKAHVSEVQRLSLQQDVKFLAERLSGDENLLVIQALVSYDIVDLCQYLYHVHDIPALIQAAGQMCLSRQLASMPVDEVMTGGKSVLRLSIKKQLEHMLQELQTGVNVLSVELTNISPPEEVVISFNAVSDARVRKQRLIKEAEGYANVILPETRGKVSSILAEANAYAEEIAQFSQGKTAAFLRLLAEYQRQPEITARLRYLNTLKHIGQKSRIIVDSDPGKSFYYLQSGAKSGNK